MYVDIASAVRFSSKLDDPSRGVQRIRFLFVEKKLG